MYRLLCFALLFFIPSALFSQVFPKEGGKLSYRIIGFSFPGGKPGICTLKIARGYYEHADSFNRNVSQSVVCKTNKAIAEVPSFGSAYTWCVVYPGKRMDAGALHHFSTLISQKLDTAVSRLRIINKAEQYKDAYVFIDCMQALYDMDGSPVWFLPDSTYMTNKISNAIDLKLSVNNAITYIINDKIKEISYNGAVNWTGHNTGEVGGDTTEHYHHEFTRLGNGHYMVMGNEDVAWEVPGYIPDTVVQTDITHDSDNIYRQKLKFGTLIEYDREGRVVWAWKSSAYFKTSDIYKRKAANGRYHEPDVHENSFYFDEQKKVIYVSCRNTSQVLKVNYPEGIVLAAYGDTATARDNAGNLLFSGQHSVKISKEGNLYLFNNNILPAGIPTLIMMQEPADNNGAGLKKIWEYTCTLDGLTEREQEHYHKKREARQRREGNGHMRVAFTSGGNVMELAGGAIFASMNGPSSKIFIVTKDNNVVWSAIPEQKQAADTAWGAAPTYRASIIPGRSALEELIRNSETK